MTFRIILVAKFKRSPGFLDPCFYVVQPYRGEPIKLPRYERTRRFFHDAQRPYRAIDIHEIKRAALQQRINTRFAA